MMDYVDNAFKLFFKFVRETESFWNVLIKETNKPLNALINLCEQLHYASRAQLPEEFVESFPDVMEKLCGKLHANIEEEMTIIVNIIEKMQSKTDELQVKLLAAEKALEKLESVDISSESNPLRPPLWRYLKANCACACVVYTELESVENMRRAFQIDQTSVNHIHRIMATTEKYEES